MRCGEEGIDRTNPLLLSETFYDAFLAFNEVLLWDGLNSELSYMMVL